MHAGIDYILSATQDEFDASIVPIRRFLTAMVHHCAKPVQFSAISEAVLMRLSSLSSLQGDNESIRRMLLVVSTPCSMRQGSRLSGKCPMDILSQW